MNEERRTVLVCMDVTEDGLIDGQSDGWMEGARCS